MKTRAVADTNTLLHLYRSDATHLIFDLFSGIDYFEFNEIVEAKRHGQDVIPLIHHDIINGGGKIRRVTSEYLRDNKLWSLFQHKDGFMRDLFLPADRGERYAIALAQTIGSMVLLTDDTKDNGPYYTVNHGLCEDVEIALAFWDLIFLNRLSGNLPDIDAASELYEHIRVTAYEPPFRPTFKSKMNASLRLFEKAKPPWYKSWCVSNGITKEVRGRVTLEIMSLQY